MPEWWNERDHGPNDDAVDEVLSSVEDSSETDEAREDAEDVALSEVEARIEVVSLYKLLLTGSFFEVDSSAARIVTKRLRKFVREEVETLLGMRSTTEAPGARLPFTPHQIEVLGRIADKVLQKDGIVPPPAPVLLSRSESVTPQQALVSKAEPPSLAKRPAAAPTAKPRAAAAPAAAPKRAPATPKRVRQPSAPTIKEVTTKDIPEAQKIFRKDSTAANGRLIQEYVDAQGKSLGEKDATPQVRPPDAIPMPPPSAMFAITQTQAMQSLAASGEDARALSDLVIKKG